MATEFDHLRLHPPNRGALWADLALTCRQAADVTGVPERRIQHWLRRGYLPQSPRGERRLSGDALDLITLIQQARDAGIPLARGVRLANEYMSQMAAESLGGLHDDADMFADAEERLYEALDALGMVRAAVTEASTLTAAGS